MSLKILFKPITHYVSITLLGVISVVVASAISQALVGLPEVAPPPNLFELILIISAIEALALYGLALRIVGNQWRRWFILFALYHCTKSALMLIEAIFYLNLWTELPLISLRSILAFELLGLLTAAPVCAGASFLASPRCEKIVVPRFEFRKTLAVSLIFVVCYLVAGAVVFIPLAGESYDATYQYLKVPWWMPLLQLVRGYIWACILWFLVVHMRGSARINSFVVGLCLSIFGAAQLLCPIVLCRRRYEMRIFLKLLFLCSCLAF